MPCAYSRLEHTAAWEGRTRGRKRGVTGKGRLCSRISGIALAVVMSTAGVSEGMIFYILLTTSGMSFGNGMQFELNMPVGSCG